MLKRMHSSARLRPAPAPRRGLSLVELMVGITIGLFVVAAATIVVTTQLRENRLLLLETQLQQDLRVSADIIAREIRRSGYASSASDAVWKADGLKPRVSELQQLEINAGTQGMIQFRYDREDSVLPPFRYELVSGVIKSRLGPGTVPQDLTDKNVLYVEEMSITPQTSAPVRLQCPNDCPPTALPLPPGTTVADYCWPTVAVRDVTVTITGRAVSDTAVRRSVSSRVRVRNDHVVPNSGTPAAPQTCPE